MRRVQRPRTVSGHSPTSRHGEFRDTPDKAWVHLGACPFYVTPRSHVPVLSSREMKIAKRCNVLIIVAVVQMSMLFNSMYQQQQSRAIHGSHKADILRDEMLHIICASLRASFCAHRNMVIMC